jgi:tetratricopeptide (TPR) repeat protein
MNGTRFLLIGFIVCCLFMTRGQQTALSQEEIPRPAHLLLNTVSKLIESNHFHEAIRQLESFQNKALKNSRHSKKVGNHHYLINFALGNCYLNTDQPDRAAEKYREVITERPRNFPAWSNLGKAYFQLQQHEKAADSFFRAYQISDPKQSQLLYLAATSHFTADQPEIALDRLLWLKQQHPAELFPGRQETLIQVLFALNRPREALPMIKTVIQNLTGQRKKNWQEILLSQYVTLNMHPAAISFAEELVLQDPLEPKWWKGLAHLQLTANLYHEALLSMTVYKRLKPLSAEEQKLMASLNLSLNIPLQATRIYEELMGTTVEPDIVKGLAHGYLKLDNKSMALKWIDTGLQHFEDSDLLLLKANLHFEQQQLELAESAYEKLVTLNPELGQAWLMWGYTAWKLGQESTARKALKRAMRFKTQKKSALALLNQMGRPQRN